MNWKTKTPVQKVAFVIACIAVAAWAAWKVMPDIFPVDPTYPAIAVFTVCEAVDCWKQKRKWSYLLIAGAVISLASFILELCLM